MEKKLTKKDFIKYYARNNDTSIGQATEIVNSFINTFLSAIQVNDVVDFAGFAKFSMVETEPREMKYTIGEKKGQTYIVPSKKKIKVKFKKAVGDLLKQ